MKTNTLKLMVLLVVSSLMVACGGSDGGKRINGNNRNRTPGVSGTTGSTGTYSQSNFRGIIYSDYSYEFQETVEAFLSAIAEPQTFLGYVDASRNAQDITFNARVETDQVFRRGDYNYVDVRTNSELSLVIFDDLANSNPNEYPPINIIANKGSYGYVDGDYAIVEFEWDLGTITFEGYIDSRGDTFAGQVTFQNFTNFDGGSGYSGTLGMFEVGTCDFFNCQ